MLESGKAFNANQGYLPRETSWHQFAKNPKENSRTKNDELEYNRLFHSIHPNSFAFLYLRDS